MPEKTQNKIIIEEPKEQERGCRWRVRPQTRRRGRGRGRGRGHSCSFAVPVAPKSRKKRHQQQQQQQQSLVAPSSFSSEHSRAPVPVVGLFFFLLFACFVFQCRARRVLRPFASSQRKTHQLSDPKEQRDIIVWEKKTNERNRMEQKKPSKIQSRNQGTHPTRKR